MPAPRGSLSTRFPASAGWWLAALALLALRVPHLQGPLDDPHAWRQCDTVHYTLDLARRGFDLLHPAVAWLGGHRTLILEFPLVEAASAVLYRAFGPNPMWDRLVSLAFFVLATAYLHVLARMLAGRRVAWLTTLAWLALPLGMFYSRAAVVDFAAVAFAHVMVVHTLVAFRRRAPGHVALAAAAGTLAALVKAPDLLPLGPPVALALLALPSVRALVAAAVAFGVPAAAFFLWRRHVDAVNAGAPDWSFLPGYYKEVNPGWWYYGTLAQRLDPANAWRVVRRLVREVASPGGAALAVLGMVVRPSGAGRPSPVAFALAWCAGALVYLAVFYPLNVLHNYYQIPFLAPAALLVGLGADALLRYTPRPAGIPLAALALLAALAVALAMPARLDYYHVDWLRVEAGRLIEARVPRGDLIVASDHDSGYSDPRLLVRADREGWSVAMTDLTPDRVARLRALGARWLAVVTDPGHPDLAPPEFLTVREVETRPVLHQGRTLGTLTLYRLAGGTGGRP